MSEPIRLAEYAWDDAETFVDRLETLCHQDVGFEDFNQEVVQGISQATCAISVSLWEIDDARTTLLARTGIDASHLRIESHKYDAVAKDYAPASRWTTGETLVCRQAMYVANAGRGGTSRTKLSPCSLILHLRFEQPKSLSVMRPTEELCGAVLSIAALVWFRHRHREQRQIISEQQVRERTVGSLYAGITLIESLSLIATVVAQQTGADRVSMMQVENGTCRLITSSVATQIDPRSRHVRLMQTLVGNVIMKTSGLTHIVGLGKEIDLSISELLESYIDESGSREIRIDAVTTSETDTTPIAALVLERFRLPEPDSGRTDDLETRFRAFRRVTVDATRLAFRRDREVWHSLLSRWVRGKTKRNVALITGVLSALVAVLTLLPVNFAIPAEGRLMPNRHVSLFAPDDAIVESIGVTSGQRVHAGDVLMVLRSSSLDLQEKTLAGELATYQSQLSAVQASKSDPGRDSSTRHAANRGDQRVLETMIESHRERLDLVQAQQRRLTIQSPIDGISRRLDMQESLLSRPIARGQRLINIVSPDAGWTAELDVPDAELGYLIDSHQNSPATCQFRLRSDPAHVYRGKIVRIENTSHITPSGKSAVRVTVVPTDSAATLDGDTFRVGATVMASVHCGHRSAGFVWFRSLIEWFRRQSWV